MSKYIPVYTYAKENGVAMQNVYRWIREHKFQEEDVRKEIVTKEVLRIKEDARFYGNQRKEKGK